MCIICWAFYSPLKVVYSIFFIVFFCYLLSITIYNVYILLHMPFSLNFYPSCCFLSNIFCCQLCLVWFYSLCTIWINMWSKIQFNFSDVQILAGKRIFFNCCATAIVALWMTWWLVSGLSLNILLLLILTTILNIGMGIDC